MSENLFDLEGRVIVLTGGAGLLGGRYTAALSRAGARVVVADLDGEAAARLAASVPGGRAIAVPTDVTDDLSVRRLREVVLDSFGRVDGLVNNAALDPKFEKGDEEAHRDDFENHPLDLWRRALDVNVTGAFLCARTFAPALTESGGGSIVNIASIYGMVGPDQRIYHDGASGPPRTKPAFYSVSKSALFGFTRYLAAYYAGRPLRVNTLTLGGVENDHESGFVQRYSARTPMGRMAHRDEYCGALVFLLSDASSYMTGANLVVDGGWTAW